MAEHPILLVCRGLPEDWTVISGELLDKLHLLFTATGIHTSTNRDECYKVVQVLEDIGLIDSERASANIVGTKGNIVRIKQSNLTKEVLLYYGN